MKEDGAVVSIISLSPGTEAYIEHKSFARIFKRLRSPGIDSKEAIPPVYVAWRTGTSNRVVVPARQAGNRFLGSLKGLLAGKGFSPHRSGLHRKKKDRKFPVSSRDVTTKLSLDGNNDVITELFLPRESLVRDIPSGDGKLVNLFLRCIDFLSSIYTVQYVLHAGNTDDG
jgi:hypothetical protein